MDRIIKGFWTFKLFKTKCKWFNKEKKIVPIKRNKKNNLFLKNEITKRLW